MAGPDRSAVERRPQLRAISRLEILDGLRSRRQLLLRTLTPIAMFLIVLGVTLLTRTAPGTRSDPYVVAVQGDLAGAETTLNGLRTDRLRIVPSSDATLDAARGADIGMLVPDKLDDKIAKGEPVTVVLLETALANESRSAAAHVRAGFGAEREDAVLSEVQRRGGHAGNLISVDSIDVQRSTEAARFETAGLVTAIILLQASMLVSTTGTRLLSRRNRGLLIAQLLLPFERWRIAISKACAEMLVGSIATIPILLLAVVATLWSGWSRSGPLTALYGMAVVLIAFVVLVMTMTAIGLLVSAVCRTQEQVSLAAAVVVVLAAVVASVVSLNGAPPTIVSRVLPVVGLVQSTQTTLLGWGGQLPWLLVGLFTTLAFAALLVRWAGRRFDGERLVLRGSS